MKLEVSHRATKVEFKLEAVKLIQERGVTVAQAAWDFGVQGSVLCRWVQSHKSSN